MDTGLHRRIFVQRLLFISALCCVIFGSKAAAALWSEVPEVRNGAPVLWRNPGRVETLDLTGLPDGRRFMPKAPFDFLEENDDGSNPKVKVRDAHGRTWEVKFGPEARPDPFSSRLAAAVGYYIEPTYYVETGVIRKARHLKRASCCIDQDGRFRAGSFQLRSKHPEFLKGVNWTWTDNPFLGTREFNGLRIMMLLTSNWDNKDYRDHLERGSNTAVFHDRDRYIYMVDDWGASMGAWGDVWSRSKWSCADYYLQSKDFIKGVKDGSVEWGYHGQHTGDATRGIRVSDVRWLLQYLGRVTDRQLTDLLRASGASPDDVVCYSRSIRQRIDQMKSLVRTFPETALVSANRSARRPAAAGSKSVPNVR